MYEEPGIEVEVHNQAGINRPQRTRNMPARLQDCVVTPNDVVNDEGELVDYVFYAYIEPMNMVETLSDPNWVSSMIEQLDFIEVNKTWSLVDLPQGKKDNWFEMDILMII